MSDIKETLLSLYEEGLDMGLSEYDAECFAYDKLGSDINKLSYNATSDKWENKEIDNGNG
jgi:hypothetical protein